MLPKHTEHRNARRRQRRRRAAAFTLIELVTVLVLLAALSTVAIPVYLEYRDNAKCSAEKAVVASVKAGIRARHARSTMDGAETYPVTLDNAPAGSAAAPATPFFNEVLSTPIYADWDKGTSANVYVGPTDRSYVYVAETGAFLSEEEYEAWTAGAGSTGGTTTGGETGTGSETGGETTGGEEETGESWLSGLTPEEMAALTDEQIAALTPEEIASLTYKQFEAIANRLSPEQLAGANPDQIAMLSAETFSAFSEAQLAALTEEQLAERAISDYIRSLTNYHDFRSIDPSAAKYLTADQIRLIPNNYEMGRIPEEVRAGFIDVQIQAIDTDKISISCLTADQRELLTGEQINSLSRYTDLRYVPTSLVEHVSTDLINSIPSSYEMSRIPEEVRAAFSAEQVQAVDTSKVSIGYLTSAQREQLTTEQIQSLKSYYDIRYVPPSRATEVAESLISTIPSSYEMSQIPESVRAAFTEAQVQALDTSNVSIRYLSEDQREQLTTGQLESLGTYYDLRYVPPSRATEVAPSLISTIPSNYEMSQIPSEVRSALSTEQVQALDTSNVSLGYLTESQREQLTVSQMQAIDSYTDLRYVPTSRVAELTPTLISTIPSSYEMSQIPESVRAAFTTSQVQSLNTNDVSIGYLTTSQREQLTTAQIESIGSYYDLRYVPSSRATEVTPDLISTIPSSYEMSRIPADVRAAFTETQIQAVNTSEVSISYLSATQRDQLTTSQIESLGSSNDIRYLSASRVPEVTTSLISQISGSYEFSQIPLDTVHAMTEAQILAIPDSYYDSIKSRLTDEQRAWRS